MLPIAGVIKGFPKKSMDRKGNSEARARGIGIAMGIKGTEVAKENADMVITDDNFASIVGAVEQGRIISGNILRFLHDLLSCNFSEILTVFLALTALICTSDTHTVAGAIGDRHGLTLGHEAVGIVHELGELAAASGLFHVGQRVAVSAITPCYACDNCQRGYPSQCGGMLGGWKFANVKDGSFAEYFHVNNAVANLAPIPDGLKAQVDRGVRQIVLLGGGFISLEFAENFVRRGISTTVVEKNEQILTPLDWEMTTPIVQELADKGGTLLLGRTAEALSSTLKKP